MNDATLGAFLRREREKRGLTLEQVSAATKISLKILQALEEDAYASLPAKPFLRGFVVSYVRFVGLDAQEVLTRFHRFIEEKLDERPSREENLRGYAFDKTEIESSRSVLWISMAAFAAVGGIAIFLLKPALKQHQRAPVDALRETATPVATVTTAAESSPTAVPAASATAVPTAVPTAAPTPTAVPEEDPLQKNTSLPVSQVRYLLLFRALDDVDVQYHVDDLRPMKIRVKKGLLLVLKAKQKVSVRVKDHEKVHLKYRSTEYVEFSEVSGVVMDDQGASFQLPAQ